jgi:large subunit ribosomal protein L15
MELSTLKRDSGYTRRRRVGRGGKRGKTSGRGGKGQTARAGNKRRPEWRDIIKKIPKRRGYGKNRGRTVVPYVRTVAVNFERLSKHFKDGDIVSTRTLAKKKLVRLVSGKMPPVKILGKGVLDKKLSFEGVTISDTAKAAIEKAGGLVKA